MSSTEYNIGRGAICMLNTYPGWKSCFCRRSVASVCIPADRSQPSNPYTVKFVFVELTHVHCTSGHVDLALLSVSWVSQFILDSPIQAQSSASFCCEIELWARYLLWDFRYVIRGYWSFLAALECTYVNVDLSFKMRLRKSNTLTTFLDIRSRNGVASNWLRILGRIATNSLFGRRHTPSYDLGRLRNEKIHRTRLIYSWKCSQPTYYATLDQLEQTEYLVRSWDKVCSVE